MSIINVVVSECETIFTDKRVFLDPFVSSHFVPWVYKNDINFFIRVDERSFSEHRDYVYDEEVNDVDSLEKCGMYHLRINLKDVVAKSKKTNHYDEKEPRSWATFDRGDVELFRKISDNSRHAHECMTQHGKTVVITKWDSYSLHLSLSRSLNTVGSSKRIVKQIVYSREFATPIYEIEAAAAPDRVISHFVQSI